MKHWKLVRLAGIPAAVMASAGSAFAAVPTEVTEALTSLKADGVAVATAILLAIFAIFAIKFLAKGK